MTLPGGDGHMNGLEFWMENLAHNDVMIQNHIPSNSILYYVLVVLGDDNIQYIARAVGE